MISAADYRINPEPLPLQRNALRVEAVVSDYAKCFLKPKGRMIQLLSNRATAVFMNSSIHWQDFESCDFKDRCQDCPMFNIEKELESLICVLREKGSTHYFRRTWHVVSEYLPSGWGGYIGSRWTWENASPSGYFFTSHNTVFHTDKLPEGAIALNP